MTPAVARRSGVLTSVALLAGMLFVVFSSTPASAADKDCSDFATQRAAQIFFLKHGGPQRDPHRLDAEGDGIACEANPCPCYTGRHLPGGGGGGGPAVVRQRAKVTEHVDGDTIKVKIIGGHRKTVRFLGIDTPEVYGGEECWGPQASRAMERLLPIGTVVRLTSDPTQDLKDRYGRILRYVAKGKIDIDRVQVRRGNAKVYVYQHNPFQRTKPYRVAQRKARSRELGLWGHC